MYGIPSLIWFLIIGLIAGFLASQVMGRRRMGFLGYLVVGVIGALVGGFLFGTLNVHLGLPLFWGQLIVAFVGSIILLFLLRLVR